MVLLITAYIYVYQWSAIALGTQSLCVPAIDLKNEAPTSVAKVFEFA